MSAIDVVARMYDHNQPVVSTSDNAKSESFDELLQTVTTEQSDAGCAACQQAAATSASAETELSADTNSSAVYRLSVFIRISGDMQKLGQGLVESFTSLTGSLVNELLKVNQPDVKVLDTYLNQAEAATDKGLDTTKTMLDSMLSAADYGLKSVLASMNSNSWMSSFGSDSSFLTGTSMADVAKIYLQDSLEKMAASPSGVGSSTTGAVSYGGGYQLQMVKGATEPLKIVPATEPVATLTGATRTSQSHQDILVKFLQLLDNLSASVSSRTVEAQWTIGYDKIGDSDTEVKKATPAIVVSADQADLAEEVHI